MLTTIPFELVQMILDFLHNDRHSLYSSSLVCRDWVSIARYHIFHRLSLHRYRSRRRPKDNVNAFLALVRSPYCTILPAVQSLVLKVNFEYGKEYIEELINALTSCHALTTLEYFDQSRLHRNPRPIAWIANRLPGIQDLSFIAWEEFPDETRGFVTSFKNLRNLSLYALRPPTCSSFKFPPDAPEGTFSHLRSLRLGAGVLLDSQLHNWQPRLETFDAQLYGVSHKGWGRISALNSMLRANQSTLVNLTVSKAYATTPDDDESEEILDLSSLSTLRSLTLRAHNADAISDSLLTISNASSLHVLAIELLLWPPTWYRDHSAEQCSCTPSLQLQRLAEVMERKELCGIKMLDVRISSKLSQKDLEFVASYFTSWKEKGAFIIDFWKD